MTASRTSASVRIRDALAGLAAASGVLWLLASAPALAAAPGARTSALTSLEEALIVTPDQDPAESRLPVVGYLRRTEDGWKLDMLPGAVPRTGPLPVLTQTSDSALEDMTSQSMVAGPQQLRVDF
jgi:hypothetical protein